MTATLRISQVAERADVSTATVRYYERVGVLPAPERDPNGYRRYDDLTIKRLGFIARAKRLGCTLDEVRDLVLAYDGGRCGPVQDTLRRLVGSKLADAQGEIVALATFSDELRRAAEALGAHRPDGPCDDRCGCLSAPPDQPTADLSCDPADRSGETLIGCSLGEADASDRLADWRRLLHDHQGVGGAVTARLRIPGGLRLEFDETVDAAALLELARAESDCCRFLGFALTIDQRGIGLDVAAPEELRGVVEEILGVR